MEVTAAAAARVQLVKRFTGGGTVIVDSNTLFATLIMQQDALPGVEPFPQPIMRWTEGLYMPVFGSAGPFALRENDYVFQHKKFGGNAQAITRGRWLHHTSFLWDYCPGNMALLKQPARAPEYRKVGAVPLQRCVCSSLSCCCCSRNAVPRTLRSWCCRGTLPGREE